MKFINSILIHEASTKKSIPSRIFPTVKKLHRFGQLSPGFPAKYCYGSFEKFVQTLVRRTSSLPLTPLGAWRKSSYSCFHYYFQDGSLRRFKLTETMTILAIIRTDWCKITIADIKKELNMTQLIFEHCKMFNRYDHWYTTTSKEMIIFQ